MPLPSDDALIRAYTLIGIPLDRHAWSPDIDRLIAAAGGMPRPTLKYRREFFHRLGYLRRRGWLRRLAR